MRRDDSGQNGLGGSSRGRRAFLITVDTEGDNLWSKPRDITVKNAETLPRFQELCERYGLRPTYLTNWEMANSAAFIEFGKDVLKRDVAEIGMHLHAWNSPPVVPLTDNDFHYQPYLTEYSDSLIREKVKTMTDTLETIFAQKVVSHRGGRFGLNERYVSVLIDAGYRVDCSVTPHFDWRPNTGDPNASGGPDYRQFPEEAYFMDPDDIRRPGSSPLLQVPLTVLPLHDSTVARVLRTGARRVPYVRRIVFRALPAYSRLSPRFSRGGDLIRILSVAEEQGRDYVEFMVHSSELMAGCSPWFPAESDIEGMYRDLEALFESSTPTWEGTTLAEYYDRTALAHGLKLASR